MPDIQINGIDMRYEWHGLEDGPVLVLIAGMGGTGSYWGPQLQTLGMHYRILVYDQRGTGGTTHVVVEDIEQLAGDLSALLKALHIERAHVVGHSTGGAIAMVMAERAPELLISLILYASIHRADAYRHRVWGLRKKILQELGPQIYAQTTSLLFYPPEYVAANHGALQQVEQRTAGGELPAPEIQSSRIDAILKFEWIEPLRRIQVPTLVYCAEDDLLTPAYFSREIAGLIPGSELDLLERGGHAFSRSRPEAFNARILSFLRRFSP